jgi:O-antigen/teichoic acid export membrane protein
MSKYTKLLNNIGLLTIGNFSSKILVFLLVPLYTSVLSTSDYGSYDLVNTTVNLMIPICTLNMQEALLRYSIDAKKLATKRKIFTNAMIIWFLGLVEFLMLVLINHFGNYFHVIRNYEAYFVVMYCVMSILGMMLYFARGLEHIKEFSIAGVIGTCSSILLNILLLLVFKLRLVGYFIANIGGSLIQLIYLCISIRVWKYFAFNSKDYNVQKEMISYGGPLILNNVSWWINNASDRYVVTYFCGAAQNGIYSVAYKIPSILSVFVSIFSQAWIVSSVKEYNEKDEDGFFSNIYRLFNLLTVLVCSILIFATKWIAKILFLNDFFEAWKYAPFLMISVLFSALSSYFGGVLSTNKNIKSISFSAFVSAVVNIILNIILISTMSVIGAAISTMVSYFIMWVMRLISVKKVLKIRIALIRDLFSYVVLTMQSVFLILFNNEKYIIYQIVSLLLLFMLYKKDLKYIVDIAKNKKKMRTHI